MSTERHVDQLHAVLRLPSSFGSSVHSMPWMSEMTRARRGTGRADLHAVEVDAWVNAGLPADDVCDVRAVSHASVRRIQSTVVERIGIGCLCR